MKSLISYQNSTSLFSYQTKPQLSSTPPSTTSLNLKLQRLAAGCAKLDSGGSVRKVAAEMNQKEEEEWMRELGRSKERKGIVELLECLEREAIMGDDQGRNPNDYNRRAQIFDKSSQVFQALKQRTTPPSH